MEKKVEKQVTTQRGGYLGALLNSCPDAILAVNSEGVIQFANKEACALTERSMNELIGKNIVIVYANPEAAREVNRKIYQAGGTIQDMEAKTLTKSGRLIPTRVSASHLYDSDGKYIGGVGYFAQYRPWAGAEAEVKAQAEELKIKLDILEAAAVPIINLLPGLSVIAASGNLNASRLEDITSSLLSHVEKDKTRVVLFDLSTAVVDDANAVGGLARMIRTIRLLGADCIMANMNSAQARALEPLLADLKLLKSYSSMQFALEEGLYAIGYQIRRIE